MRSVFLSCVLTAVVVARGASEDSFVLMDHAFDELTELLLEQCRMPGVSIALVHKGSIEAKGYGFSQLPSTPATADTLYFGGSTAKAFTAAAAGKIVHNVHRTFPDIKWTTPLSGLLPGDFALHQTYESSHITLEDALSHRSGLPGHDPAYGWDNASARDIVKKMRYLPLSAEPRTRWQYNNMMYIAASEVVSSLTNSSLESVLAEWFWTPLGMLSTTFSLKSANKTLDADGHHRLARGYYWTGTHYIPEAYVDLTSIAGAGAIISSVNDYALWAQALLNAASNSRMNESSPVTASLYRELMLPRALMQGDLFSQYPCPVVYALGWIEVSIGSLKMITHSGGLPGFGTEIFLIPEHDLALVAMGNTVESIDVVAGPLLNAVLAKLNLVDKDDAEAVPRIVTHLEAATGSARPKKDGMLQKSDIKSPVDTTPIPGTAANYIGIYFHPGYGYVNVSLIESIKDTSTNGKTRHQQAPLTFHETHNNLIRFQISPSSRVWPLTYTITHNKHTSFHLNTYMIRGLAPLHSDGSGDCNGPSETANRNLKCKNEQALELIDSGRAIFELGLDGSVDRLGMELEPEMVEQAEESGKSNWRQGMIWFEKEA